MKQSRPLSNILRNRLQKLHKEFSVSVNSKRPSENHFVQKQFKISDAFRNFIWDTIPKIEEKIELKLISEIYEKMDSDVLRNELLQSYKRRKMHIESKELDRYEEPKQMEENDVEIKPFYEVGFNNIHYTSEETVGLWQFNDPAVYKSVFPKGSFGDFEKNIINKTGIFALL